MTALRSALEPRLRDWWRAQGTMGSLLSGLAMPAEAGYRLAVAVRNAAYDAGMPRASRAPVPVVSIGNLTVGGTGKTPVTAWVVRKLQALGAHPAVLLRGYGNDEVHLHRRWNPAAPVFPDPDRLRSAHAARAAGADVVVLDDGFQHRRLARDLDGVVISAEQPFPGRRLPRGPFREGPASLARANALVVTRRTASDAQVAELLQSLSKHAAGKPISVLRLATGPWMDLAGAPADAPAGSVLAVAGVAEPRAFEAMVAAATRGAVELLAFPDHHDFDPSDARAIASAAQGRAVVVTEKDAVKLVRHSQQLPPVVRVLPLVVHAEAGADQLELSLQRVVHATASGARA